MTVNELVNGGRNLVETEIRFLGRTIYDLVADAPDPVSPFFDPAAGRTVLDPARAGDGHWRGAPDAFYDAGEDAVYLYARTRTPFERGKMAGIWRTVDGRTFEQVWNVTRGEVGALSLEGAALRKDEEQYELYLSYHDAETKRWRVARLTADALDEFGMQEADRFSPEGYWHVKNPVIHADALFLKAPSRFFTSSSIIAVNLSADTPAVSHEVVVERDARFAPRLTSVLPVNGTPITFYDWRPTMFHTGEETARYGVLNESTVTPMIPADETIAARTGTGALRYISAVPVNDEIWFFYEKADEDGSHSLQLNKVPRQQVVDAITVSYSK